MVLRVDANGRRRADESCGRKGEFSDRFDINCEKIAVNGTGARRKSGAKDFSNTVQASLAAIGFASTAGFSARASHVFFCGNDNEKKR
jgi:hypothetical protein